MPCVFPDLCSVFFLYDFTLFKTLLLLNCFMTVSIQFFLFSIYVHFQTYCTCSQFFFFGLDLTFCVSIAFSDSVSQTLNGMTLLSTWH